MSTRVCVLGGVAIRRVVTTQGRVTRLTGAQVHPLCADLHALLAFRRFGCLTLVIASMWVHVSSDMMRCSRFS